VRAALAVNVNDVEWTLQTDFGASRANSEDYVMRADHAQQTAIVFGDGCQGARLSTGVDNVRVRYRAALGAKGNAAAMQIDQLIGAPLGVKKVVNPLPAQGGADPDGLNDVQRRAPLAVTAMDRLVSVADYADFVRNYAGVGKASAQRLNGVVQITVAGLTPRPFDMDGPVIRNLHQALTLYGDPAQRFVVHDREASLLIIAANVSIDPRRQWPRVERAIRDALLKKFSYEDVDLGEDLLLSDALQTIQNVDGVEYVDIDKFDAVSQREITELAQRLENLRRRPRIHVHRERLAPPPRAAERTTSGLTPPDSPAGGSQAARTRVLPSLRAAQLCFLPPDIAGALILEQLP
jgi:predicted phage baseplate assembly protein